MHMKKMKKNKKILWFIIIPIILILTIFLSFIIYNIYSDETALSLKENKWIDTNKNNLIDLTLPNDVPIISYDGSGLILDFLKYVENETNLKFNKIANKIDNQNEYNYSIKLVDTSGENDLLLLRDNYILVNNNQTVYNKISDINNLKIGIIATDQERISKYFNNSTIEFVTYNSYSELINALNTPVTEQSTEETLQPEEQTTSDGVDTILILKTLYMQNIIQNDTINIAYEFTDLTKDIVFSLNGEEELNSILKKMYIKWSKNNYQTTYNEYLLQQYYIFKSVNDSEQRNIKSKKYVYGFVENGIYNYMDGDDFKGINNIVLKNFADFSGISLSYKKYKTIDSMLNAYNNSEIDFIFNNTNLNITDDNYQTNTISSDKVFVISKYSNDIVINSIQSLKGKKVSAIKNSKIEKILIDNEIDVKSYSNLKDLSKDFSNDDIVIIEKENYIYYKDKYFVNTKIDYILDTNIEYQYLIKNIEENKNFNELLDFYITYSSIDSMIANDYSSIANITQSYYLALILLIIVLTAVVILSVMKKVKLLLAKYHENKKLNLTKEEKIKYIDQLTLLKNRAYYNSRVSKWEENKVYPQAVIVIDLNNISYINDNYGLEEGDKVITEAANILIQSQLPNTEIIRTDGNEFLIYLVGYDEKHIITYLRKLNKALSKLSHGFGAASGYSLITDDIKTIDDALNEATIDMKNNKEDIDY